MFSKGSKQPPEPKDTPPAEMPEVERPRPSKAATMPSIVSAGLQVTGNLISDGDVQIEGMIEGDIRSRMLTVGEEGAVKGSINASEVVVSGTVEGKIRAQSVTVAHTARVIGDIIHDHLAVEAGAYVNGSLKRLSKAPTDKAGKKTAETFAAVKKEIATLQPAGDGEEAGAKS